MIRRYDSVIVNFITRALVPFIQLFALYVIAHGHFSPGGGFQGGAILAASVLLVRLALGRPVAERWLNHQIMRWLAAAGVLIFAGVGLIPLLFGHNYLDYSGLPLWDLHDPLRRELGILFVEIGVGIAVLGVLVTIFDHLAGWRRDV